MICAILALQAEYEGLAGISKVERDVIRWCSKASREAAKQRLARRVRRKLKKDRMQASGQLPAEDKPVRNIGKIQSNLATIYLYPVGPTGGKEYRHH